MPDPVSIDVALRPLLVDAKQAARLLGIGRTTFYELIHAGAISPLHIGRCVRFAVTDLEAFVANGCVVAPLGSQIGCIVDRDAFHPRRHVLRPHTRGPRADRR